MQPKDKKGELHQNNKPAQSMAQYRGLERRQLDRDGDGRGRHSRPQAT